MGKILCEQEVCQYLGIPSIPLKEWDNKASFKSGVAVTKLGLGDTAYAVCTFDAQRMNAPRIIKTFANQPFYGIDKVYVVPNYMETDVETMDLDEESKKKAAMLVEEAKALTKEGTKDEEVEEMKKLPEWIFPEITSYQEAYAWLAAYNKKNKIKGAIPTNEETLKMRLLNIYSQQNKTKKKK